MKTYMKDQMEYYSPVSLNNKRVILSMNIEGLVIKCVIQVRISEKGEDLQRGKLCLYILNSVAGDHYFCPAEAMKGGSDYSLYLFIEFKY